MNVAFDPWIPVVDLKGKPELISLEDVFIKGKKYADLAVRPHERVALMRLLICISHTALDGPKNYKEWQQVPKKLPEAASMYLEKWKGSFELFHKTKPWLQIAGLEPAKKDDPKAFTNIAKLDFALSNGSGTSLFEHYGYENDELKYSISQLILGLITINNFSTCGLIARPLWNDKATASSAKDAPCIASSMLHVFLAGENIFETICINVCDYEELSLFLNQNKKDSDWIGRPVWENMPKNDDISTTKTFLGRLVPLSRAILLFEDSSYMLYGEGLKFEIFPDYFQEFNTSVAVRKSKTKEERYLVGARIGMRPWRQLDSILQYNLMKSSPSHALNLKHLSGEAIDIWVGTLIRNPGKQNILDTVESRFHISKKLRTEQGCAIYADEVKNAYEVSRVLGKAAYIYRINQDSTNETGKGSGAVGVYWTSVENNLSLLMQYIEELGTDGSEEYQKKWQSMLWNKAREAYQVACGKETPRQMRAFAKGWQVLTGKKDEKIETKEEAHAVF